MKKVAFLLVRLTVSFGIAWVLLYLFILLPKQQALDSIKQQTDQVGSVLKALENGQAQLKASPSVSSVELQTMGSARGYAEAVNTLLPVFNVSAPAEPKKLGAQWQLDEIGKYNTIISDKDYSPAVKQAVDAANQAHQFSNYHFSVMAALANVLEYNPTEDTKSDQPELVKSNLEAAAGGLEKAISKIQQAPSYGSANSDKVILLVRKIEEARSKYYSSVISTANTHDSERDIYISTVASVQSQLIDDRDNFWKANIGEIETALKNAEEKLNPFAASLRNL